MTLMDESSEAQPRPHLLVAPNQDFWSKRLFFARYDEIIQDATTTAGGEQELEGRFPGGRALSVAKAVVERAGGGLHALQHLLLVGAFTESKHSEAIEAVGLAMLGADVLAEQRTPSGKVRRHAVMALLYEADPAHIVAVSLWDRHLSYRRTHYRRKPTITTALDLAGPEIAPKARGVLERLRSTAGQPFEGMDEVYVVPCANPIEMLVALREWPKKTTGRDRQGDVLTVDVPDWTVLVFSEGGQRLEVSDRQVDRAARFARDLTAELGAGRGDYEVVLDQLDGKKLDEFLALVTNSEDDLFPLVEIVAEAPWRPHQTLTLTGTSAHTTEALVGDLRRLHHPFARDWRTVRQFKFLFEQKYKILVHFPPRGEPASLSFSDDNRGLAVTRRLVAFFKEHLHVDIGSKARRGTTLPARKSATGPRKNTALWWREVLAPYTDAPDEWLDSALKALEHDKLIRVVRSRVFLCGSPYINRRAVGVDSLDCDGVVELPYLLPEDDRHQDEDDGEYTCSQQEHRWRALRFGLPTVVRVKVDVCHDEAWKRLLAEVSRFGEVSELPGRPGIATLRADTDLRHLVYEPLIATRDELHPETFGTKAPAAWVLSPGTRPPDAPIAARSLDEVLADPTRLADQWGGIALKRRPTRHAIVKAPMLVHDSSGSGTSRAGVIVIELRGSSIIYDREELPLSPTNLRVLDALRLAAAEDEADDRAREERSWETLDGLLPEEHRGGKAATWQTWVSRTRSAIAKALGDRKLGKRAIVGTRGYRLGDDFVVVDRRLQAESSG
jgi:hypothetical protein